MPAVPVPMLVGLTERVVQTSGQVTASCGLPAMYKL